MNVTNNKNLTNTMPSSSAPLRVLERTISCCARCWRR